MTLSKAINAASDGPIPDNRSVTALPPRAPERLTTARVQPVAVTVRPNGPDPGRPAGQGAADASRGSPSGLPALTVGTEPNTLP